eukprot:TRINITY_DN2556_c0_g1_i5.p1 TRINITY_DN2556_c0_g1~~TRINITY_DN2556_c0_g1_i5.p1  ORF type:complete len:215 (+),score=55.17 TRINITY_DN2556_c0_g1_i5:138-782(+)
MEGDNALDLDSILDRALEDLGEIEENAHIRTSTRPTTATTANSTTEPVTPTEPHLEAAELLRNLAADLEKMKEGGNPDSLLGDFFKELDSDNSYKGAMEGMMKQIISKEVLYEPMKDMYDRYPTWLEENKGKLAESEYFNYLKQYGYIEQILYTYDTVGDEGLDVVLKLMQEMQGCGQVPLDIVKQLAPDVEFDGNGAPKFPPTFDRPDQCQLQ